jgi:hypothetical protein
MRRTKIDSPMILNYATVAMITAYTIAIFYNAFEHIENYGYYSCYEE